MADHFVASTIIIRGPFLHVDGQTYSTEMGGMNLTNLEIGPFHLFGLYPEHLRALRDICTKALAGPAEVPG